MDFDWGNLFYRHWEFADDYDILHVIERGASFTLCERPVEEADLWDYVDEDDLKCPRCEEVLTKINAAKTAKKTRRKVK